MNHEQGALVGRLKEAGVSLKRFLKVGEDKAAFEMDWDEHLYTPDSLDECPRWGICGREGLVLIDADNSEMAAIIRRILPKTFETISPRRQLPHFYYKVDGGVVENRTLHCEGDTKGAGEIRAQNHYVVAPGTEIKYIDLATGEEKTGRYTILEDRSIAKVRWTDFINAVAPYLGADVNQKITWEQMREGVPQGTRHAQGIKYATFLIGALNLDPETALHQMDIWNGKNRPPMAEHDLKRMVQKAIEYAARERSDRPKEEFQVKRDADEIKIRYFIDNKFVPKLLADEIMRDFIFKTMADTEEIYVYVGGVYQANGENMIKRECEVRLGEYISTHRVNEVIGHIQRSTYVDRCDFDDKVFVLNLDNGLLNINGGELMPHTPDNLSTVRVHVDYNPEADCPAIKKFLSEVVNECDVPVLEELVGYCLYRGYPIHKAIMLVGEGANGKSTVCNLVRMFLGKENVACIALQDLDRNRFASGGLFGRMANIYPDLSPNALYATGKFKMLTGGDLIGAEKKFGGRFTFENYAKLMFSANRIPMVEADDTMAFFRRWVIINFPNIFVGDDADKNLLEKLTTPEELSGMLNLAVAGLKRLLENGRFSDEKSAEDTRVQYIKMSDSVHAFVLDCVLVSLDDYVEKKELYSAYCVYCRDENLPMISDQTFFKRLYKHIRIEECQVTVGDKRVRALSGITLSSDDDTGEKADTTTTNGDSNNKAGATLTDYYDEGGDALELHRVALHDMSHLGSKKGSKGRGDVPAQGTTPRGQGRGSEGCAHLAQGISPSKVVSQNGIESKKGIQKKPVQGVQGVQPRSSATIPKISQQMWLETFKESWKIFSRLPHSRVQGSDFNVLVARASEKLGTNKETAARYLEGFVKDKVFPISLPEEKGAK